MCVGCGRDDLEEDYESDLMGKGLDGFCIVEDIGFVINDTHLFSVSYLNMKLCLYLVGMFCDING
jgi:hypothetical protein